MIGAGDVGLVSAACFSEFGWKVTCTDKDADRIEQLRRGRVPIYEPRLEELLERNLRNGRISFSTELAPSVGEADLVFLAVGTPMRRGDGHADLSFVFKAVEELAPHLNGYTVIATKSTVPVGTSREIEQRLKQLRPDADFAVCSNPEFLREGSAIYDCTHPDRVLVGCDEERARMLMERLYKGGDARRRVGRPPQYLSAGTSARRRFRLCGDRPLGGARRYRLFGQLVCGKSRCSSCCSAPPPPPL
jgi:UDPglucose 6-dehydrogenase